MNRFKSLVPKVGAKVGAKAGGVLLHVCAALSASARLHIRDLFSTRIDKSSGRLLLVMLAFLGIYGVISAKLVKLGLRPDDPITAGRVAKNEISTARPNIIDRNGEILATDVATVSLFAEPRKIVDKDEAAELLNSVFPELNGKELREKLGSRKGFIWVKREITPQQRAEVHRLGLPGVGFLPENKRFYPNGPIAAHVLGAANLDNEGISGIEKWIDAQGLNELRKLGFNTDLANLRPVQLSIDMRVTHAMREELHRAMLRYKAKAAAGAIIDVNTGEVISLVSLPDYDPNSPAEAMKPENINRLAVGVYEMGSTLKAMTTAMALDSGKANINSSFDARAGLRYGRFTIKDFHGKHRVLSVPEIFVYSSNIGSARMALSVGVEGHKAFLRKMGQLDRMVTELPENAMPIVPRNWGELNTITISFGHGLAVAPLQAVAATAALVNGGTFITPTFIKRTAEEAKSASRRVIKAETSEAMRYVMRLNAERGSAARANIPGYFIGGKTGTSEKVIGGRYSKTKNLTTFMAVVPADKPRYLFLTLFDEPEKVAESGGASTAAVNAAPATGYIIERVGPMLDYTPRFDNPPQPFPLMTRLGAFGTRPGQ
jgi:cell division protein FtsI (penicillin-binding protein 3)